jgi:hypothetical protein
MKRNAMLRAFLCSRRARVTPQEAGVPPGPGLRRVPGLRREEVALLAGISVDYYVRVEQGGELQFADGLRAGGVHGGQYECCEDHGVLSRIQANDRCGRDVHRAVDLLRLQGDDDAVVVAADPDQSAGVRLLHFDWSTCVASLVAQNRGYSWGISRALRAAVLPKPLVESRCDDEVPPRNEKVVGSIALDALPAMSGRFAGRVFVPGARPPSDAEPHRRLCRQREASLCQQPASRITRDGCTEESAVEPRHRRPGRFHFADRCPPTDSRQAQRCHGNQPRRIRCQVRSLGGSSE